MNNNIYKYRKYKEKYLNLYKKIHGGIEVKIPNTIHTSTKLVYVYNDPNDSNNNFYVFSIDQTPYFQIIQFELLLDHKSYKPYKSYYVTGTYLKSVDDQEIINDIIRKNLSTDLFNITDIGSKIDLLDTRDYILERTHVSYIYKFNNVSYIMYIANIKHRNIIMIQSTSPISDTIYYISMDYLYDRDDVNMVKKISDGELSTDILNPTIYIRQKTQPTQEAQSSQEAQEAQEVQDVTQKCPICKIDASFVKMLENKLNRCNICSGIPKQIFVSYCDHMYCESCFQNPDIQKINFENIDRSRKCENQDHNNVIDCKICEKKNVKFSFNFEYEGECPTCKTYKKGMMIGCCGDYICVNCFMKQHKQQDQPNQTV
jgi:hypothetical protein